MVPDFLTIAEAGALIAKRELSPVELVQSRFTRIERLDGKLNSFIRRRGACGGSLGRGRDYRRAFARAAARHPGRLERHL